MKMTKVSFSVPSFPSLKVLLTSKRVWVAVAIAGAAIAKALDPNLPVTTTQVVEGAGVLFAILVGGQALSENALKNAVAGAITAAGQSAATTLAADYPASQPTNPQA